MLSVQSHDSPILCYNLSTAVMGLSPATDTHGLSAIPSWHGHHRLKHCHPAVASHSTPDNAAWYLTSKFSSWSATFRDIKAAAYDMLPHPQVLSEDSALLCSPLQEAICISRSHVAPNHKRVEGLDASDENLRDAVELLFCR